MARLVTPDEPLTLAHVDPDDDEAMDRLEEQELASARERVKRAVEDLHRAGILDKEGRRVSKELPADMRSDSKTDA